MEEIDMKKRWLAFLLSGCLTLAVLSGCSSNGSGSTVNDTDDQTSQKDSEETSVQGNIDTDGNYEGVLTEKEVTFTAFVTGSSNFTTGTFTESVIIENPAYNQIFENTNVKMEFIVPTSGEEESQFNLLIASGKYPDFIISGKQYVYPGGFDQAIEDGAFFDLTDYAEEYMPNYWRVIHENEQILKEATTLKNRIPCAYYIYSPEYEGKELIWEGQAIRLDILDELGLDMPETIDDWEVVLTAMKDHGVEVPYSMINCTGMDAAFLMSYGIAKPPINAFSQNCFYANEEGKITYGAIEDGYKEYLNTMNRWYKNGLLDSEFMTRSYMTVSDTIIAMYGKGQIGAAYVFDGILPTMVLAVESENEKAVTKAVPTPILSQGDTVLRSVDKLYAGNGTYWAITNNCSDPILAMRFLDYMCSPEGINLTNYGVEGDAYTMEDGIPAFTEKILGAEVGTADSWRKNSGNALCIIGQEPVRNMQFKDANTQEWDRVWTESAEQYSTIVSLSAEEETRLSTLMGDITTYVQEMTIKAIIDEKVLNNWDEVVQKLEEMGMNEVLEMQQAGYDRYNNR